MALEALIAAYLGDRNALEFPWSMAWCLDRGRHKTKSQRDQEVLFMLAKVVGIFDFDARSTTVRVRSLDRH